MCFVNRNPCGPACPYNETADAAFKRLDEARYALGRALLATPAGRLMQRAVIGFNRALDRLATWLVRPYRRHP